MDPLLAVADDLERRDVRAAAALLEVERLSDEVDAVRAHARETVEFFRALPARLETRENEELEAARARGQALVALTDADADLERARDERERLAAARAVQQQRDGLHAADVWVQQAEAARASLEGEAGGRRIEAGRLEQRAAELAPRVPDVDPPSPGIDGVVEWAARARGALLVARSALATERERVVREANELLASVLGEPLAATGVAGVRDRIARALSS